MNKPILNSLTSRVSQNNRGDKPSPPHKKFDFKCCKQNTIKSLNEIEYFLNNFHNITKFIRLYKILK